MNIIEVSEEYAEHLPLCPFCDQHVIAFTEICIVAADYEGLPLRALAHNDCALNHGGKVVA